jgi:RND family efflux transporter MFP subunit
LDHLVKENIVTKSQYDMATADLSAGQAQYDAALQELKKGRAGARAEDIAAAEARIKQLEASIKAAAYALEDTVLKAPFDGIINQKLVENFEAVTPGAHVVSLLDFSTVDVRTDIPEEMVLKRKSFTELTVMLDAYPQQAFPASIKELGLKTDPANQSFPLTASLVVPTGTDIQPGMTASVNIAYSDNSPGLDQNIRVPAAAVYSDEEGSPCIWKIDIETLAISATKVMIHEINGDWVSIASGLSDGDHIVTAGARFLTQNQIIKPMETDGNSAL